MNFFDLINFIFLFYLNLSIFLLNIYYYIHHIQSIYVFIYLLMIYFVFYFFLFLHYITQYFITLYKYNDILYYVLLLLLLLLSHSLYNCHENYFLNLIMDNNLIDNISWYFCNDNILLDITLIMFSSINDSVIVEPL